MSAECYYVYLVEYMHRVQGANIMSAETHDFSNFELMGHPDEWDDPRELADGLLYRMAEMIDPQHEQVDLRGDVADPAQIGKLQGLVGKNKVLRDNHEPDAWDLIGLADIVEQSGVQKPLNRSLENPDEPVPAGATLVMTGGMANWMDRGGNLLVRTEDMDNELVETVTELGRAAGAVILGTGNRKANTGTEKTNPHVIAFGREAGTYPTETSYAGKYVVPRLERNGLAIIPYGFETDKGQEVANGIVERNPDAFTGNVAAVRVANAGMQLAEQIARAAKKEGVNPRMYVVTDGFPIARTEEQVNNAAEYQNPRTAARQIVATARAIALLNVAARQ